MKTVKLGRMNVADFVVEKPVGIRNNGDLIYPKELVAKNEPPSFGLALVSVQNKVKLAVERFKAEPDFQLGVLNKVGLYSKSEVIKHIQDQTSLGLEFAEIEAQYAEYFSKQLLGRADPEPQFNFKAAEAKVTAIPRDWAIIPKAKWKLFKSRVLFCENTTDNVTTPAANYRIANVHTAFAAKGFEVIVLKGADDIRTNFITKAKDSKVVYISGIGHGSYSVYTGHGFNNILGVGSYDPLEVKGKVMHLLSCETARDLGPNTVSKEARAFAGYTENFVFDWANADMYWKCDSQFDISMANGKTVEQAISDTYVQYNIAIASVPGTSTAATLLSDRNLLRSPVSGAAWGSKTAKLSNTIFSHITLAEFAAHSVLPVMK